MSACRHFEMGRTTAFAPQRSSLLAPGGGNFLQQVRQEFAFIELKCSRPVNELHEVQSALEDFDLADE